VFAGLVQAHAALQQNISVSPTQIYIPSGVASYTVNISIGLKWWAERDFEVLYRAEHLKGASLRLSGGWYGSDGIKVYTACNVKLTPDTLLIGGGASDSTQTLQVAYSLLWAARCVHLIIIDALVHVFSMQLLAGVTIMITSQIIRLPRGAV
jgi:hypothetical protein